MDKDFFIFDYEKDLLLVDSLLESMSIAHKQVKKSEEWFMWKFRDNPFGKSILACAKRDGKIIGCVAYGIQNFSIENKVIIGAKSFETFVHPDYQGYGIFSELIKISENAASARGIALLMNFPNLKSLKGFKNMGWSQVNICEYWMKVSNPLKVFLNYKQLKLPFISSKFNNEKVEVGCDFDIESIGYKGDFLQTIITNDYLRWRFTTLPDSRYITINVCGLFSIARIGTRGNLIELQVLFSAFMTNDAFNVLKLKNEYKKKVDFDILSFPISKENPIKNKLKRALYLKVPNSTNMCYKILNPELETIKKSKIILNAINFHTY